MSVAPYSPPVGALGDMPISATSVGSESVVLALRGEIDAALSWELDVWLEVAMEGRRRVVLEMGGVSQLGSPARGVIAAARQRFRRAGGELVVRSPRPEIRSSIDPAWLADPAALAAGAARPGRSRE